MMASSTSAKDDAGYTKDKLKQHDLHSFFQSEKKISSINPVINTNNYTNNKNSGIPNILTTTNRNVNKNKNKNKHNHKSRAKSHEKSHHNTNKNSKNNSNNENCNNSSQKKKKRRRKKKKKKSNVDTINILECFNYNNDENSINSALDDSEIQNNITVFSSDSQTIDEYD